MLLSFPKHALYSIWVTWGLLHRVETLRELPTPSPVRRNGWERLSVGSSAVSRYVTPATPSTYRGKRQLLYKTILPRCCLAKQANGAHQMRTPNARRMSLSRCIVYRELGREGLWSVMIYMDAVRAQRLIFFVLNIMASSRYEQVYHAEYSTFLYDMLFTNRPESNL